MPSMRYLMVRSAKGASRTTHDGCAAPGFRPEANSFTCSYAWKTRTESSVWSLSRCAGARSIGFAPAFPGAAARGRDARRLPRRRSRPAAVDQTSRCRRRASSAARRWRGRARCRMKRHQIGIGAGARACRDPSARTARPAARSCLPHRFLEAEQAHVAARNGRARAGTCPTAADADAGHAATRRSRSWCADKQYAAHVVLAHHEIDGARRQQLVDRVRHVAAQLAAIGVQRLRPANSGCALRPGDNDLLARSECGGAPTPWRRRHRDRRRARPFASSDAASIS